MSNWEDKYDEWKLSGPDYDEDGVCEDNLDLTFEGTDDELDEFMPKLEELARELAREYGIKII